MGFSSTGESFAKNVLIGIFGGPDVYMVGVGSNVSSGSFEIFSSPKDTATMTTDAIAAPIASEGACINEYCHFFDTFSVLYYFV